MIFLFDISFCIIGSEGTEADSRTRICLEQGAITNEIQHPLSEGSQYETSTPNSVMAEQIYDCLPGEFIICNTAYFTHSPILVYDQFAACRNQYFFPVSAVRKNRFRCDFSLQAA